jgi:hypothetical protein
MNANPNYLPPVRGSLAFCLGVIVIFAAARNGLAQEPSLYYTAQLAAENVMVDLKVNGFPVERLPSEGTQGAKGSLLGSFIKQGVNSIELQITPMLDGGAAELRRHLLDLEVFESLALGAERARTLQVSRITDLDEQQPNKRTEFRKQDEIETVLRKPGGGARGLLSWNQGSGAMSYTSGGAAEQIQITVTLPRATLVSLPWQTPQPALDGAAITAIRAKVADLHTALSAKDWPAVEALLDAKLQRQSTAFGIPRSQVFTGTLESLDEIFFSDGFALAALVPTDLVITAVDDINLFKVTVEGGDPIRGEGGEYGYSMPLFFSWIDGAWEIVE